jgi:hypothetical protein
VVKCLQLTRLIGMFNQRQHSKSRAAHNLNTPTFEVM